MSWAKLTSALEAQHNELKDIRLHQYTGDKAGSLEGEIYYDPTLHGPKAVTDAAHKFILLEPDAAPPTLVVGQTPSQGTSIRGMRSDAKPGLPGLATSGAHGFMDLADKAKLDAATAVATASTLALRDGSGRLVGADASSGQQLVNFQTLQAQLTIWQQGKASKDPVRALFTSLPAYTYSSGTKRATASANGALPSTDGVGSWNVDDRIMFTGVIGTGSVQAGLYKIIQVGSAGSPWIIERTDDFGGPLAPVGQRIVGAEVQVLEGTDHGDSFWVVANDSVILDTTIIIFQKQTKADVDNSTIELDGNGNIRVKDAGVSNAKLASMAQSTIKGRASGAGTGTPTDLTAAQVWAIAESGGQPVVKNPTAQQVIDGQSLKVQRAGGASDAIYTGVSGDSVTRFRIAASGLHEWSPDGVLSRSVNLYPAAADHLRTDDLFQAANIRIDGAAGSGTRLGEYDSSGNLVATRTFDAAMASRQYLSNIGDGATATIVKAHGLGTKDLHVTLMEVSTGELVGCRTKVDATNITLYFTNAPAIDEYRLIASKA